MEQLTKNPGVMQITHIYFRVINVANAVNIVSCIYLDS